VTLQKGSNSGTPLRKAQIWGVRLKQRRCKKRRGVETVTGGGFGVERSRQHKTVKKKNKKNSVGETRKSDFKRKNKGGGGSSRTEGCRKGKKTGGLEKVCRPSHGFQILSRRQGEIGLPSGFKNVESGHCSWTGGLGCNRQGLTGKVPQRWGGLFVTKERTLRSRKKQTKRKNLLMTRGKSRRKSRPPSMGNVQTEMSFQRSEGKQSR